MTTDTTDSTTPNDAPRMIHLDEVWIRPTDLTERELDDLLEAYDQSQEAREDTLEEA